MIFDKVENISIYKGMHPKLDIAIDDILSRDLSLCPCGKRIDLAGGQILVDKFFDKVRSFDCHSGCPFG